MQKKFILRVLSLVLSLALFFSLIPVTASANETEKVNGAAAIMATASSQVGYYEGSGDYSKYGEYFGKAYGPWCGAFVSWCARTTGIPESVIPTNLSSTSMRDHFKSLGLYHLSTSYGGSYIPKQGDLVFFTSTNSSERSQNNITHIGFVLEATSSYVTCIEGNCPDRVRQIDRQYTSYIVGFATPRYEGVELENNGNVSTYKAGTYVTEEIMNFRKTPGGEVITTIPAKTTIQVTAIEGVWGKAVYNGTEGWLSLQYSVYNPSSEVPPANNTETLPEVNNSNQYRVTETMNIRASYTQSSSIIGSVPAGTLIQVSEVSEDNWGKVTYDGVTGWISLNWSVKFEPEVDWLVIDISQWNAPAELDWKQLKSEGVKGVIIRIGGRGADSNRVIYSDNSFLTHYKAAKAAGMYVGVYFFSYALTKEQAIEEAQFTVDILETNNCKLDLPVYIDMEDYGTDKSHVNAGKETCSMVLDEFCKVVENAGYIAGIYCSRSFAEDFVESSVFEGRSTWIADWGKDVCCYNGNIDMWQYTENGKLKGTSNKDTDLNRLYIDYPTLINTKMFENGLIEKGDINFDGNISAADSRLALRCAVELEKLTPIQSKIADTNDDGKITSTDARNILRSSVE
ncbi:MAG: SH3 domain-containing protein [Clostridia bacterium]|nr:SH3 domain-containing protein [Clostridia bacterium]